MSFLNFNTTHHPTASSRYPNVARLIKSEESKVVGRTCENTLYIPDSSTQYVSANRTETHDHDLVPSENRTTEISAGKEVLVIVSTLIVERASPRHAGNYSCMVPGKAKTTVAVHVLNGEYVLSPHVCRRYTLSLPTPVNP